jgi:hypothetical protein
LVVSLERRVSLERPFSFHLLSQTPHTVLPKCRTEVGDMFDEDEDEEYPELDENGSGYQEFDVCPYCGTLLNELNGQVNCPDCGEVF